MASGSRVTDAIGSLQKVVSDRENAGRKVGAALIRTAIDLLKQERELKPKR